MIGASPPLDVELTLTGLPDGGGGESDSSGGDGESNSPGAGFVQRLASEPNWSALPELPVAGRSGFGLLAEMGESVR